LARKVAAVAAKVAVVAVIAVLIAGGAVGLFLYTSSSTTSTTIGTSADTSSTNVGSSTGTTATSSAGNTTTDVGPSAGYQVDGQPYGAWADYLGYIPNGYVTAPHLSNAPTYPCPSGMDSTQCKQFQQSCGNGVCDPNESCATCPIDCGVSGELTCDPYTGRAGAPVSVCQIAH
jgi:hypothetical protein